MQRCRTYVPRLAWAHVRDTGALRRGARLVAKKGADERGEGRAGNPGILGAHLVRKVT